tara:strand:+ start:12 stop:767 length:756 start_codon:yes stop_codon:yes gene_type:complete
MGRFKFSDSLGSTLNSTEYNSMLNDFTLHINNGGLEPNDFKNESLRYRHLKEPPAIFLWKEIQITDALAATLNGSSYDNTWVTLADVSGLTNSYVEFTPTYSDSYAISVTAYWYPYCLGSSSLITISQFYSTPSVWTPNESIQRYVGATKGIDPASYFIPALSPTTTPAHYYYNSISTIRPPSAALSPPVVVTGVWGISSSIEGAATSISKYSVAIKRDTTKFPSSGTQYADSVVSPYDKIYIFATARAVT